MANLAVIGIVIYLFLMIFMRIPELLVLGLGIVLLLVGLALVELVGKAVWRLIFGDKGNKNEKESQSTGRNHGEEGETGFLGKS